MGNKKRNLDDLKNDLNNISDDDMKKIKGGRNKNNNTGWGTGCGGIVPQ